jgi:mono/diheme cytochrome c family protein
MAGVIAAALTVAPAWAQDSASFGREGYRLFCAGCHGADGKGNPAVSSALGMPSVDLTRLARDRGGVFPAREVALAIAGESAVISGHESLDVPPWAQTFAEEFRSFAPPPAIRDLVDRRIAHIVAYLQSIQD